MAFVRVIGGKAKGLRLSVPRGRSVRPTADKVKEALFNIISSELESTIVLDLYAGSGALGIEALSRGALHCTFIEKNPPTVSVLKENIRRVHCEAQCVVLNIPVEKALPLLKTQGASFHLIMMDPPYEKSLVAVAVEMVGLTGLLKPEGWLVAEHNIREKLESAHSGLELVKMKKYGETCLSFFQPSE
jgi:16S rRNA (guanine(966)-N(2))-methyltransferase RsmD